MYASGFATVARRCPAVGRWFCRALQHGAAAQRIGYVAPQDMLDSGQQEIFAERDRKLEAAREQRRTRRQQLEPTPSAVSIAEVNPLEVH